MRLQIFLILTLASATAGAVEGIGTDGWHTWRVAAIDDAPDWCCLEWNAGNATRRACNLDSRHIDFGTSDRTQQPPEQMQVYALFRDGDLDKLRILSPRCEIEAAGPVKDLGIVDTGTSVDWLRQQVTPRSRQSSHALAAIAVHEGGSATETLETFARSGDNIDNRKDAVFWMAQLRVEESADVIRNLIRYDGSAELRQHALFAYSESAAPDRMDAIIDVIENRDLSRQDRKNALFWLAQDESDTAMAYLEGLLLAN